ncbi:MAG: segregation/condensation protein A [Clostridia bacterium]|nr:segregation/condensation protein A [Clostridia bacterium]
MDAISYKLPVFEGPLDLLLYLVQKNKLNIYDIPIAQVLEQYMDTIRQMQEFDMEVATEFLDMAARLVQIKSTMLLPKHEEESEQLRRELTGDLIEYQLCRQIAAELGPKHIGFDLFVREEEALPPDYTYRRQHPPYVLCEAYLRAAGRGRRRMPPSPQAFRGIVSRKIVSVSSRIVYVLRNLYRKKTVSYRSLFTESRNRSEMVATFLALLELIKGKRIKVDGEGDAVNVSMIPGAPTDIPESEGEFV